ncbi:kinetochore and Eb1-associated basic protein isoform X2 [Drosophila elegans]|uniref:kinetochore and Eb1-associated basic protein isoform X2 n=1 Tax=Drosophila elegans TaxID=30023 RepID=UPI0007E8A119|nr:kinetochore and Eb1-associated basic protein isoform X2 [Drosophila elegans]
MATSPDVRTAGFLTPLRSKELLERQRGSKTVTKMEYLTPQKPKRIENPDARVPSIIITEAGLERPKELLLRLERSIGRPASASKIPYKNAFLTTQNMQRTWEGLKTTETRSSKIAIPASEPRPLRSKELLQDLKCHYNRGTSATKITAQSNQKNLNRSKTPEKRSHFIPASEPQPIRPKVIREQERQAVITNRAVSVSIDRPKTRPPTSSFTSSRLLVPSTGFSYPKDPKSLATTSSKATKLTNSKRKLDFHTELDKDSLRPKLERFSKDWHKQTDYQLSQFISDFVKQLVRFLPSCGVKFKHPDRDCYIQQMMEGLQQLQYSKKVNESWLRMPIGQQAMGHVLEMLLFLLNAIENRKEQDICVSEEQNTTDVSSIKEATEIKTEQPFEVNYISKDIMRLQQNMQNLSNCRVDLKSFKPASTNDVDKLKDEIIKHDYAILLDVQEERLHELQLHRLRLQEFSELVSLAKLKLNRCYTGNKEGIDAFNKQIQNLEDSPMVSKKRMHLNRLHLNLNFTLDEINERKEQLQRLYEENFLNLLQLNI